MKYIATPSAPAAIGPYSQAILSGNTLYASGQIPINPASGQIEAADIAGQTEQACQNVGEILKAAGMGSSRTSPPSTRCTRSISCPGPPAPASPSKTSPRARCARLRSWL